jgi:PAS domain S-box-containing protein
MSESTPLAHILVIDDEEILRETLRAFLEEYGFRVETAGNGRMGLELLRRGGVDLALLDLRMPEMDGLEVLKRMREEGIETPIVVVSGAGAIEDAIDAVRCGAWDYVIKPVADMAALRHVVDKALEKARLLAENRRYQRHLEEEVAARTKDLCVAQARLVSQNVFLSALLESIPNPVFYTDGQGVFLGCNTRFAEFAKTRVEDLAGRKADQVLPAESAAVVRALEQGSARGRVSLECRLTSDNGEEHVRHYQVAASALSEGRDVPAGVVAVMSEVTEYRRLEKQLVAAKESAEAASKAKDVFLANMSHELRTPLSGMLGMLQLLAASGLDPQQSEWTSLAMASGRTLVDILSDILDITRIESGQLETCDEPFELEPMLQSIVDVMQGEARAKGLKLGFDLAASAPNWVAGDPLRLRQIILNVLGNAVKFTPTGQVWLRVNLIERGDGWVRLLFEVSDTGVGIPEDKLQTVFDPFTQADASYAKRYGGVGLGLSIVKRLVSMLNGELGIVSEPGKGTTIRFSLRLGAASELSAVDAWSVVPETMSPRACVGRILIAEDEAVNRLAIEKLLEQLNYRVETVADGAEVFPALSKGRFDAVLMDIQMPGMDGMETTRRIRRGEALNVDRNIPIVALTAFAMKGDRERFLEAGFTTYMTKPFELEELAQTLNEVLPHRDPRTQDDSLRVADGY